MRLIRQVSLEYQQGTSDKVYEVDLCALSTDQFVVNFRYGRRGTTLRDGTKTPAPLSESTALKVFEDLVASKVDKGYRHTTDSAPKPDSTEPASPIFDNEDETASLDPRRLAVLKRIAEGHESPSAWRLSRAVWRAGELRIHQAEVPLLALIGSGDSMLDYCIASTLGQTGSEKSLTALRQLESDKLQPDTVRRMAAISLLQLLGGEEREQAIAECVEQLPAEIRPLVHNGPSSELETALTQFLAEADHKAFGVLELLYLIDNEHARPALLSLLRAVPLQPNYFQRIRHIFKAAEMRRDAELYGLLACRFETSRAMFRMQDAWHYNYYKKQKPTIGPQAEKAFSAQTQTYLRKRVWWTLKRLGELEVTDYAAMATGVLLAFSDDDARETRRTSTYDWEAYRRSNYQNLVTIDSHFDRFADYWAFNQILYGNSPRYEAGSAGKSFRCKPPYEPGGADPAEREEAFPHLWERQPGLLLQLVSLSRCEVVHCFAVKVLRACDNYCRQLELSALISMLRSPYEVTAELGFELALQRYDPHNIDAELVLAMANCAFDRARTQAHHWIGDNKYELLKDRDFVLAIVSSPYTDTRIFARDVLQQITFSEQDAQVVIGRLIALLQSVEPEDGPLAADVAETLLRVFATQLRRIGADVIRDLLGHSLPEVQQLAGDLVLGHESLSQDPPADLLQALLEAEHPAVRGIGVRLIGQMPDHALKNRPEMLIELTRHDQPDIRDTVRPIVARLVKYDRTFGRSIAETLIEALLVPGAADGVPSHTARVLIDDLRECLDKVPADVVWNLLQSRSAPAQEVGGTLLPTNLKLEDLDIQEIVALAGHEILAIREAARTMCTQSLDRIRAEPEPAVRLLDAKWADTRQFGIELFRQHLCEEGLMSPKILVSICDSVRPDVQQFGRELITRLFEDAHGEEYILKLSEHPGEAMQLFASNFLEQHASDNLARLGQLAPYIVSVLSRVNKGRVAKDRILRFLESEAMKSEAAAQIVGELLARYSATTAIGDKATAIEVMLRIHSKYPSISLPIAVQPVEIRGGV